MNLEDQEKEQETQVENLDIDMEAASAEISDDLFGQGEGSEVEVQKPEGEQSETSGTEADASKTALQSDTETVEGEQVEGENSAEVQATGAPSTWTKEALQDWAAIPPRAQQEILKREQDMMNGLNSYKERAEIGDRYSKVAEPYAPILAAENVDPVGLFQSFAANHYKLSRGTEAEKVALAADLLTGYDIPLGPLLNHIADRSEGAEPADPKFAALEQRLNQVTTLLTEREQREQKVISERIAKEIDDFAADPKNPYFNEVAADIQRLFAAGAASSLQDAYDKAVWANPTTRQKELDRLNAEKAAAEAEEAKRVQEKRQKAQGDHVEVLGKPKDGTVPKGSMDDTLAETLAAIEARG